MHEHMNELVGYKALPSNIRNFQLNITMGNCTSSTTVELQQLPVPGHSGPIQIHTGEGKLAKYYSLTDSEVPYFINFINDTDENYFFGVYKQFPDSPKIKSIAWQVRRVSKRGSVPTTSNVCWTMPSYGIAIANWDQNQKGYMDSQKVDADLGNVYEVVSEDEFPNIDPKPIGTTSPGLIVFENNTKTPNAMDLDMGFTEANNIIAIIPKVGSGYKVVFDVHPAYYVSLYRNIKLGQLVDSGIVLGPVKVEFKDGGKRSIGVKAYMENGLCKLKVVP